MADRLGVAVLDLSTDQSKFDKGIDSSHQKVLAWGKAGVLAAATVTAAAVAGGVALFHAAAQMDAQIQKANTVFGDQIGRVQEWAEANAHAMGLTTQEAITQAAAFADLLIPMGFTRDTAADMSTQVIGLAGALSEWSGGTRSAAEVSAILASAMLGERDALKGLGISISDADVQQRLLANGTANLTGKALEQAKAIATQQLIFEKSTDAQTKFANGQDSLLRMENELRASYREARDELIRRSIPALYALEGAARRDVIPAIGLLYDRLEGLATPVLTNLASVLLDSLVPALRSDVVEAIGTLRGWLDRLGSKFDELREDYIDPVIGKLGAFSGKLAGVASDPRVRRFLLLLGGIFAGSLAARGGLSLLGLAVGPLGSMFRLAMAGMLPFQLAIQALAAIASFPGLAQFGEFLGVLLAFPFAAVQLGLSTLWIVLAPILYALAGLAFPATLVAFFGYLAGFTWDDVVDGLGRLKDGIADLVTAIAEGDFSGAKDAVGGIIDALGEGLTTAIDALLGAVSDPKSVLGALAQLIYDAVYGLINLPSFIVEQIATLAQNLVGLLVTKLSKIPASDIGKGIASAIGDGLLFLIRVPGEAAKAAAGVAQWVADHITDIGPAVERLVRAAIAGAGRAIKATPGAVKTVIEDLGNTILNWLTAPLGNYAEPAREKIKAALEAFAANGGKVVTAAAGVGAKVVGWIVGGMGSAGSAIAGAVGAGLQWILDNDPTGISGAAARVASWIVQLIKQGLSMGPEMADMVKGGLTYVSSVAADVVTAAKDLGGDILGWIMGGLSGIGDAIANAILGALRGARSVINTVISGINVMIDAFNVLPGPDIDNIPYIPAFGQGALIRRPTLGMVGEAGPEAIVPLNRAGDLGVGGQFVFNYQPTFSLATRSEMQRAANEFWQFIQRRQGRTLSAD